MTRGPKPKISTEAIRAAATDGLSMAQAAKKFSCSSATIWARAKNHDIKFSRTTRWPRSLIEPDVLAGLTTAEIASRHGTSHGTILRALKTLNLTPAIRRGNSATSKWLSQTRLASGLSLKKFSEKLGISQKLFETWLYSRDIPKPYERIIYLAASFVAREARCEARKKLRTLSEKK